MNRTAYDVCIERFGYQGDFKPKDIPVAIDQIEHIRGYSEVRPSPETLFSMRNLIVVVNNRRRINPVKRELMESIRIDAVAFTEMVIFNYKVFFVHQDTPEEVLFGFKPELTSYIFVY